MNSSTMARLVLLAVSGTLLLCQTLANFAPSGGDDDGSYSDIHGLAKFRPTTLFGNGSIEEEKERFARQDNQWDPHSHPPGSEAHPYGDNYPAYNPHQQPFSYPQPQSQPGAYHDYQPSPAVQHQHDPYTAYQPSPAVHHQHDPYNAYQPSPAVQHQPDPYTAYQPSPAVHHQPDPYTAYQPSPAVHHQPNPYDAYQPFLDDQPQAQPSSVYQHAPAAGHQGGYLNYQPYPAEEAQAQPYSIYQPTPAIYPPPPPGVAQPLTYAPPYPSPCQQTIRYRYIPGAVIRRQQCQQRIECGWKYIRQPGRYVIIRVNCPPPIPYIPPTPIIPVCPRPWCNNIQPGCYPPAPPPRPVPYRPMPCAGHNHCSYPQQCCYDPYRSNMGCLGSTAMPVRSTRHLQLNSTVTSRSLVELVIRDWRNSEVKSFVTDLLLPLKVDLENDMEVILSTDPEQNGGPCDSQDTECIGSRILSCVYEMWPSVTQPPAVSWSVPINTSFLIPPSDYMGEQPEAELGEPLANTANDLANYSEEDSWSVDDPAFAGGEPLGVVEVDPVSSATHARQVRLLSFTACLLQSFGAGVVERKKSALLSAKRCVRAYKLEWPQVRACVAPRGQGVVRDGLGQDSPHTQPIEIIVNGVPAPVLDNLKLALCRALLEAGQAPLLCDLLYDEMDQRQEEQGLVNTEEDSTNNLSFGDLDSPSLRHTDYQGPGTGWTDQRFSHGFPGAQTQGWAYGAQDTNGSLEAYGTQDGAQKLDLNLKIGDETENQGWPEETEDRNAGFRLNRVSQSMDEVPASSPIWTAGLGNN